VAHGTPSTAARSVVELAIKLGSSVLNSAEPLHHPLSFRAGRTASRINGEVEELLQ